jgi:prevent-host-death family protein
MEIAVSEAKARLTDLVRRAEAGDEVILTRHGRHAVRLVPVEQKAPSDEVRRRRRELLDELISAARANGPYNGPPAERVSDFLYDENGLPA